MEVRVGKPSVLQLWFFSVKRMPLEGIEYESQSCFTCFPAKSLKWVLPGLVGDWALHRFLFLPLSAWSQPHGHKMAAGVLHHSVPRQHPELRGRKGKKGIPSHPLSFRWGGKSF